MNFVGHNNAMVDAAISKVRQFDDLPVELSFTIRFEGFGSGGTSGVTAQGAVRYLRDLAAVDDPHYRYQTKIKSITVEVKLPPIVISI